MALRYDRAGLEAGQWWRLLTAHLVHLDLEHAALNALGLVMMWALFARDYHWRQWLVILATATLMIDAGLWFRDTGVAWYVGSSGVLAWCDGCGNPCSSAPWGLGRLDPRRVHCRQARLRTMDRGAALREHGRGGGQSHLYGAIGGLAASLAMRARPGRYNFALPFPTRFTMLENDLALVTGASRGIGSAIALGLAQAGATSRRHVHQRGRGEGADRTVRRRRG